MQGKNNKVYTYFKFQHFNCKILGLNFNSNFTKHSYRCLIEGYL